MNPTIGRIVIYKTTESDKATLRHLNCNVNEELPATVVGVWGPTVINVKVHVDGNHPDLWKTSINEGDQPGNWSWPKREEVKTEATV